MLLSITYRVMVKCLRCARILAGNPGLVLELFADFEHSKSFGTSSWHGAQADWIIYS